MKSYDELKEYFLSKKHYSLRKTITDDLSIIFSDASLTPIERMTKRFEILCQAETPIVFPGEKIAFIRTISNIPDIFTESEWKEIKKNKYIHERGYHSNINPDYALILEHGLRYFLDKGDEYSNGSINALIELAYRYVEEAKRVNNIVVANSIQHVIEGRPTCFLEALQLFRIIHFGLWLEGNYHITIGRFDKYMYPFYKTDIESGKITKDEAYQLVEEFFLSFNKDNDLYPGIQQGDNGQSLVLGGLDENGNEVFNELSSLCLKASGSLMCIDPKINIRVHKNTPISIYEEGTELTKKGLGFPQYTNDDLAISSLVNYYGSDYKDACNYVVAACWELIIPGCGTDIANIGALSFNKVINRATRNHLLSSKTMDEFINHVQIEIQKECDKIADIVSDVWFVPSPLLSLFMKLDNNGLGKYNNFGIHGTGICNAADSLYAIEKYIFKENSLKKEDLIDCLNNNFKNNPSLLHKLRYETEKVGQDEDEVDKYLVLLLDYFSNSLEGKRNLMGGRFRAGTGSAMYYLWHANEIGASPDGRLEHEPLGTNFSVSLFSKINGPLTLIKSLTKPNFFRAMNGGPVTLEFDQSIWSCNDSISKFARFVKTFFALGGHQLQLNSVNLETLLDAQKHPEKYERLIVRVWGWSAYFTALEKPYQDHVIKRQEYKI